MATSGGDSSVSEHFRELLQFVSQYRWVYDIQMTRFVELKWWEHIPTEVGLGCVLVYVNHFLSILFPWLLHHIGSLEVSTDMLQSETLEGPDRESSVTG